MKKQFQTIANAKHGEISIYTKENMYITEDFVRMNKPSPVDSIRDAMLTVSPKRQ